MKKQNRDQKRKQFKYGINKNKKKKLVDPDALNDKGDNKTLRELAGLGAVLGAGAAGMAFMPNNTVHAAEQTAADQNSAVVGSVSANKIQNEGSVAQEQNNSKTQLDKTVNSEDKESSSTTSDVKSESTDSVLSSENKSNHKSKLTDSVSSVNDNSKSIASTSSVSNNSKSIASISSVNSNSNNNSASAVSTRLSNISDSIISNNSNESLSSLKANNENSSSLSYRTLKNSNFKVLLATNSVERQKTHDQDVSNKLTNVDTTLSYFSYNDQSQTTEIKSGQTPTIHPEMSEGLHTNISFTVPKDVGAGDFFDISWSNNMNLYGTHDPNDSSYDTGIQITDQEGNVIAKEDKSNSPITGNKARLVFTDYVNTHNNVSGNVNFHLFIDPKNVPNDSTETTLKVGIGKQQISRKVDVQYTAIDPDTVSNGGTANGEAFITKTNFTDHTITSVVYVNPLGYNYPSVGVNPLGYPYPVWVDIQNLENSDINFMPGQGGGDGPLQYTVYRIKDDAEPNQSFYIDPSQVTDVTNSTSWASNNNKLTINMPTDEPSNSRYIITYTTKYNSNTQTQQGEYEVPIKTRTTINLNIGNGYINDYFYWDNDNTYHMGSESGSGTPAQSASASASHSASVSASQSHSASVSAGQSHSASVSASQSHSASVSAGQSHSASVSASQASAASESYASQRSADSLSHDSQLESQASRDRASQASASESYASQGSADSLSHDSQLESQASRDRASQASASESYASQLESQASRDRASQASASESYASQRSADSLSHDSQLESQASRDSASQSASDKSLSAASESYASQRSADSLSQASMNSAASQSQGSGAIRPLPEDNGDNGNNVNPGNTTPSNSVDDNGQTTVAPKSEALPQGENIDKNAVAPKPSVAPASTNEDENIKPLANAKPNGVAANTKAENTSTDNSSAKKEKDKLPQTGENENKAADGTILGGLATLLGLLGFKKRNRKD